MYLSFFLSLLFHPVFLSASSPVHIPFQHSGTLHQVNRLIMVDTTLDVMPLLEGCEAINHTLYIIHRLYPMSDSYLSVPGQILQSRCHTLSSWTSTGITRPKRQLALIAIGSVLGAFGLHSLFHRDDSHALQNQQHEITALAGQMARSNDLSLRIARALSNVTNLAHEIHTTQIVAEHVGLLSSRLDHIIAGLADLLQGKLSPSIISPLDMQTIWQNASKLASTFHLHLPFDQSLNLYELPVEYTSFSTSIAITLAIPLISTSYSLYEYIPFPVLFHSNSHFMPVIPQPFQTHIAVDHSSAGYLPLTTQQLASCITLGSFYFCSHLIIQRSDSCIQNLFFGSLNNLTQKCPLFHYPDQIALEVINSKTLLVSLHSHPISYSSDCLNGSSNTHTLQPGHQIIPLSRDCTLSSTNLFTVPTFSTSRVHTSLRSSSISMDFSFQPLSTSDLPDIVKEASAIGQQGQHLLSYIKAHPLLPSHPDYFLFGLIFISGFAFISYFIFLYFKAKKANAATTN